MKIQYANYIEIVPTYAINSISGDIITLKSGYSFDKLNTLNNIEPEVKSEKNDAGVVYQLKVSAGIEKFSEAQNQKYGNSCNVILIMYQNDKETQVTVGTLSNPVQMVWTPAVDYDELTFTRDSIFPVL